MVGILTFTSGRFEDAQAHLTQSFCRHQLVPCGTRAVQFSHSAAALGAEAFNTLSYGAEIEVQAKGFEDFYMFEMPLRGGVDIEIGQQQARSAPGQALCLSPGQRFRSRWRPDTYQWMLQISRGAIEAAFEQRTRRRVASDIVFDPVIDLRSEHGHALLQAMQRLAMASDTYDAQLTDSFQQQIDAVVALLVANLPYFRDGSPVPQRLHATPRHVRRAIDIMQDRFAAPLSVADLAVDIGVSERALYDGFQRYYQKPPYEVLMRIRMEHARVLVRAGDLSLADVARRVGMPHQGRFSAQYKKSFGLRPLEDRRQAIGLKQ
nr:AraC family transcriptional regulator [uncultured Celeribacter sp.]